MTKCIVDWYAYSVNCWGCNNDVHNIQSDTHKTLILCVNFSLAVCFIVSMCMDLGVCRGMMSTYLCTIMTAIIMLLSNYLGNVTFCL